MLVLGCKKCGAVSHNVSQICRACGHQLEPDDVVTLTKTPKGEVIFDCRNHYIIATDNGNKVNIEWEDGAPFETDCDLHNVESITCDIVKQLVHMERV